MTERRYSDDEVSEIFAAATEGARGSAVQRRSDEGLTLADLQQIGAQVGLAPDTVAQAALALELRPQSASQSFLGLPIGVESSITLNRWMTDEEWENLVGELRAVFHAKGKVGVSGAFREWSNGNLRALLEPVENGHRLHLSTLKGSVRPLMGFGAALVGTATVVAAILVFSGHLDVGALIGISMLAASGLGLIATSALRLKGWARRRAEQLEAIATRAALPPGTRRLGPPPSNG